MAKPTDEIISLPDYPSTFVSKVGDEPEIEHISLQDLHQKISTDGQGLIIYFYPRDNTPGCTTQARDFTSMQQEFADIGYSIVGISRDSAESHKKFITGKELTIGLLSDEDEKLCNHFDVIKEKNMYGKKTMGLVRSTFVYDADGTLTHAQRNLRAKGYADRLLDILKP